MPPCWPGQAHVADAAGDGPLHRHHLRRHRTLATAARVECRHPAERRTQAGKAAGVGGIADGAGDVVSVRERRDARGHRGGGAAARPAGRVLLGPRVPGAAAQIVLGVEPEAEGRRVGAADDDGAGRDPVRDHGAVFLGDEIAERHHPVRRGAAGLVDVLLDRHRHAVQRAEGLAPCHGRVGAISGGARGGPEIHGHGVQPRIDGGHPFEARRHRLPRRDLPAGNRPGHARRVPSPDLVRHLPYLPRNDPVPRADRKQAESGSDVAYTARYVQRLQHPDLLDRTDQANDQGNECRQCAGPCRTAGVLLPPRAGARHRLPGRADELLPARGHRQHDAVGRGRDAGRHPRHPAGADGLAPRRRGCRPPELRVGDGAVEQLGGDGRRHRRAESRLRHRGRPAVVESAPECDRHDRRAGGVRAGGVHARGGRAGNRPVPRGALRTRAGLHHHLEHRPVAGGVS